jgi:hypothetical protein
MIKASKEATLEFMEKVDALKQPLGNGKVGINQGKLVALVRGNQDAALAATLMYCAMAASQPKHLQLALTIAIIYKQQFKDQSLQEVVTTALDDLPSKSDAGEISLASSWESAIRLSKQKK